LAGDGAVRLSWTAADDTDVTGARVYSRAGGEGDFSQLNFAPLPASQTSYTVQNLSNSTFYDFKVVTVDGAGRESVDAPTVSATPSADNTATVTFTVDARSQGAGTLQLRRFDTGSEIRHPMTATGEQGIWELELELPLLREIAFKFGNAATNAKNSGYEGDNQPDRRLFIDKSEMTYSGVYDFITVGVPSAVVTGTVRSGGSGLKGATVNSTLEARYYYALTFHDGSYYLPLPSGTSTTLTASAPGYGQDGPRNVSAGDAGIDFTLTATTKYRIDGDLSGWTPKAILSSSGTSLWGGDNDFQELLVDWDDAYLYLGYRYRTWGNSAIIYMDSGSGGSTTPRQFNAWPRRADFATPVNFFLAQYEGGSAQFWQVGASNSVTSVSGSAFEKATAGSFPAFTTEFAIPWTTLGYSSRPNTTLNFYAGIFGGDHYGAGDIAPNPNSTPSGNNSINQGDSNNAIFNAPFSVTVTE
ncbi:MAG: fibronectin type III domain-containing protein, partial [Deinococcota bacterium]|nr:fibronectin type III domain-containing protein [Deinococcota bacterium]